VIVEFSGKMQSFSSKSTRNQMSTDYITLPQSTASQQVNEDQISNQQYAGNHKHQRGCLWHFCL